MMEFRHYRIMKKRYFLQISATLLGLGWLVRAQFWRTKPMATQPETFAIQKTDEEWRAILTQEQFHVLRKHGTERAGTSPLDKVYDDGTYSCVACDQPLFTSTTKFNSRTGWPSFYEPIAGAIATTTDRSLFMTRVEVHCSRCGGHLGHVFNDGPQPTGQRYCMNGVSLKFTPAA
jgi:peptide-methionine (R)-S-oxide reductase